MKKMFGSYTVSSHSTTRAVVNGPNGGLVVRDGEDIILEGVDCTVTIVPEGVVLSSKDDKGKNDKVTLSFDSSLTWSGSSSTTSAAPPASSGPPPLTSASSPPASGGSLMPPNLPH